VDLVSLIFKSEYLLSQFANWVKLRGRSVGTAKSMNQAWWPQFVEGARTVLLDERLSVVSVSKPTLKLAVYTGANLAPPWMGTKISRITNTIHLEYFANMVQTSLAPSVPRERKMLRTAFEARFDTVSVSSCEFFEYFMISNFAAGFIRFRKPWVLFFKSWYRVTLVTRENKFILYLQKYSNCKSWITYTYIVFCTNLILYYHIRSSFISDCWYVYVKKISRLPSCRMR